ncbi:hypothetical protein AABV80_003997 [Enterobacter ludwigii]|jgi:hypothetical protein
MNALKAFEYTLKQELKVISWEITEEQLINIAKDIVYSKQQFTSEKLSEILFNNGITELSLIGCEGLDFSNMMALLQAAQDVVDKDGE